eukprot:m51a1_g7660 hypothetical protein (380) ;mRNA; f:417280-418833
MEDLLSWANETESSGSALPSSDDAPINYYGFLGAAVSIVCFGTNFIPVKKFHTGDGVFFQWVMCMAIWCVGLGVYVYRGFPKFEPLAMLGGFLWCSGNVMAVPVIEMIGLGLGMALWCSSNLVIGWFTGAFGLFGLKRNRVLSPELNYAGAAVTAVAILLYATVTPNADKKKNRRASMYSPLAADDDAAERLLGDRHLQLSGERGDEDDGPLLRAVRSLSPGSRRVLGVVLAVVSGLFYGTNFNPPQYRIEHGGSSKEQIDYAFPHFCGVLLTSTAYMLLYAAASGNRPRVYPRAILPGFLSGLMWAAAQVAWFYTNTAIGFVISFPLNAAGPTIVANLVGVLVFREISGRAQYLRLTSAILVSLLGVSLITLSQVFEI